jgi:uncharacterized protein (DUF885 family)
MHALGWSREKAVQYMLEHTAASEANIRGEVIINKQKSNYYLKSM